MAREVFQLRDANDQATKYVGLTDDNVNLRVHVGHFFSYAGRDYGTYEGTLLWQGKIEDFSQDVIDELDKGRVFGIALDPEPEKVTKRVKRSRG